MNHLNFCKGYAESKAENYIFNILEWKSQHTRVEVTSSGNSSNVKCLKTKKLRTCVLLFCIITSVTLCYGANRRNIY